jgi:hypothetical protein
MSRPEPPDPWCWRAPVKLRRVSSLRVPKRDPFSPWSKERRVPFIRISGDWLSRMGFPQGGEFKLTIERPGVLVLESEEL